MKYKDSGVDIDAATGALAGVREALTSTWGPDVASEVGSFGGLYRQPDGSLLVSSIDGVGTKVLVALAAGRLDGVGADLVNHCVNDILVQGAEPLFFLDYYATGRLAAETFAPVIEGMARACRENGCALIGGETAEMPGLYGHGHFDLAGCIVGRVEPAHLITGETIEPGMNVYAWASSGLHTNGYSLVRRALLEGESPLALHDRVDGLEGTLAEALLAVHRSYLPHVRQLRTVQPIAGLCHITGGGLLDNVPRILPEHVAVEIDADRWDVPPLFGLIADRGGVPVEEMQRVFNLGLGMLAVLPELEAPRLATLDEPPRLVGRVLPREGGAAIRLVGSHRGL